MAASSSSSSEITQEEFFAFHNIDRQLFSRLVLNLRREPSVAMQAAALWLWLERLNMAQYVVTILTYPDTVFEALIEETLLCLRAAESHEWFYTTDDVPMVQSIVGKHRDGVNLRFFHENRIIVLLGVGTIIQQICIRAFQDFIQFLMMCTPDPVNHLHEYPLESSYASSVTHGRPNVGVIGDYGRGRGRGRGDHNLGDDLGGFVKYPPSLRVGDFSVPLKGHFDVSNHCSLQESGGFSATNNGPMPPVKSVSSNSNYILETQTQGLQGDIIDQFIAQMRVSENSRISMVEEMQNIPSSERTIFLTFSKGYPISETELHEFFNRSFGDIIETLYMQEVGENEQPLYAKLVVRDANTMEVILSGQGRSKFSINGKHVWARKYVRKNANSPPSSPPYNKTSFTYRKSS